MAESDSTMLLPEWRQAVKDFLAAGFKEGDIVPHAWLEQHFDMAPLDADRPIAGRLECPAVCLVAEHRGFSIRVAGAAPDSS